MKRKRDENEHNKKGDKKHRKIKSVEKILELGPELQLAADKMSEYLGVDFNLVIRYDDESSQEEPEEPKDSPPKKEVVLWERDSRGLPLYPTPEIVQEFSKPYLDVTEEEARSSSFQYHKFWKHAHMLKNQVAITSRPWDKSFDCDAVQDFWHSSGEYELQPSYQVSYDSDWERRKMRDSLRVQDMIARVEKVARGCAIHTLSRKTTTRVYAGDLTVRQYEMLVTKIDSYRMVQSVREHKYYRYQDENGDNKTALVTKDEWYHSQLPPLENAFWFLKKIRNQRTGILHRYHIYRLVLVHNPITQMLRVEVEFKAEYFDGDRWLIM